MQKKTMELIYIYLYALVSWDNVLLACGERPAGWISLEISAEEGWTYINIYQGSNVVRLEF